MMSNRQLLWTGPSGLLTRFERIAQRFVLLLVVLYCPIAASAWAAQKQRDGDVALGKSMDYGPVLCHSVTFVKPKNKNAPTWAGAVTRGLVVDLRAGRTPSSAPGPVLCYDMNRLAVAGLWFDGCLDLSKTHHTSYKGSGPPRPGSSVVYQHLNDPGWLVEDDPLPNPLMALKGYYLFGHEVVLSYQAGDRKILECPSSLTQRDPVLDLQKLAQNELSEQERSWLSRQLVSRTFRVGPGQQSVSALVASLPDAQVTADRRRAVLHKPSQIVEAALAGHPAVRFRSREGTLYLEFPPSKTDQLVTVWLLVGRSKPVEPSPAFAKFAAGAPLAADPAGKLQGGKRRWPQDFQTQAQLGGEAAAYTVDELPIPDHPYGSWMRLSAIDCFPDGRIAVATLSGDVWIVTPGQVAHGELGQLTWQRFATGLYEPLGMKIVKNTIYIRGRDRITRLHDLNNDGEADYYENFHCQGEIGPGYHAFIFDLVCDRQGNFYYVISGRKCPSVGEVVKLSPDGKHWETIATRFRHPNGLGCGGPNDWLTIADNPDGKFPSGGMLVRRGQEYGQGGARTEPFLYLLPPKVDTSSGSQCWSDPKRWGPLGGCLTHTSYSKSNLSYVLIQETDKLPNGFAVQFPFQFRSGLMRAVVNPADGQVYVAGQRGWDSAAASDGCLARVRYTGQPAYLVTAAAATKRGIQLTFSCDLNPETVNYDNVFAERIGQGQQEVDIEDVKLLDQRTMLVEFLPEDLLAGGVIDRRRTKQDQSGRTHYRVIDPLALEFRLKANNGTKIKDTIYCTINSLADD